MRILGTWSLNLEKRLEGFGIRSHPVRTTRTSFPKKKIQSNRGFSLPPASDTRLLKLLVKLLVAVSKVHRARRRRRGGGASQTSDQMRCK